MIAVWGTPIITSVEQILNDIKLELYGTGLLKDINNTGSDIMITCPFHKGGREHNPSCGVLLQEKISNGKKYEAGTVHCYTCGYTADLPQFIADLMGYKNSMEGYKYLISKYHYTTKDREALVLDLARNKLTNTSFMSLEMVGDYQAQLRDNCRAVEYLQGRGITPEVMSRYKCGYDARDDVVLFPVYDIKGNILFFKGRSITGKHFYNAKGVDKSVAIYGLYQLLGLCNSEPVWIVESEIDALCLVSKGINAIALMGCYISEAQCRLLESTPFRRYVIATDNDDAGRKGAALIKQRLIPKGFRFINLKWDVPLKDINDLILAYGDNFRQYLTEY